MIVVYNDHKPKTPTSTRKMYKKDSNTGMTEVCSKPQFFLTDLQLYDLYTDA